MICKKCGIMIQDVVCKVCQCCQLTGMRCECTWIGQAVCRTLLEEMLHGISKADVEEKVSTALHKDRSEGSS